MEMSGIVVLLIAILASRMIIEQGYRKLNSEEKLRLMDGFSTTRAYSLIPLLVLVGTFWFLASQTSVDRQLLSLAYFGLLIAYIIIRAVLNQRKLAQLELPSDYIRLFTTGQVVSFLGIAWYFFTLFGAE